MMILLMSISSGTSTNYKIDDQTSGGNNDLSDSWALLTAASNAMLGIRFYDTDTSTFTAGGTTKSSTGSTRYNTIMDAAWVWPSSDDQTVTMAIHENDGSGNMSLNNSLVFEFDNTDAYTAMLQRLELEIRELKMMTMLRQLPILTIRRVPLL